jgi:hypothetical protein
MISLSIASLERISEDRMEELDFIHMDRYEDYEAYSHPVYVNRRVGFAIIKFFDEYYKLPQHIAAESLEEGDDVLSICRECFSQTMYDSHNKTFYCPRCESQ